MAPMKNWRHFFHVGYGTVQILSMKWNNDNGNSVPYIKAVNALCCKSGNHGRPVLRRRCLSSKPNVEPEFEHMQILFS